MCASKNLKCFEETINRNHVVFGKAAGEDLQENEVNVIGNWRKKYPCYVVVDCSATMSLSVVWNVKHMPDMI